MYLLFDIGGTNIRVGLSGDGHSLAQWAMQPTPANFSDGIKKIAALAQSLIGTDSITAVSGGIAGILDASQSTLVWAPNLTGWIDQPLKDELSQLFKVPIFITNDAALAGLGEAHHGAGKGYKIVAYLTASTGTGGARIVNGEIDHHIWGFEPGQQIIKTEPVETLEQIISTASPAKKAEYLAYGLNNIITLWSPEVVIVGGGRIDDHTGIDLKLVEKHLQNIFKLSPLLPPPLIPAHFKQENGLWGALVYLQQRLKLQ